MVFLDQITLPNEILFSALVLLFLYLAGDTLLAIISKLGKKGDPFASLDLYQRVNFRIFFGMVFAFIFLMIFSISNQSFFTECLGLAASVVALSVLLYSSRIRRCRLSSITQKIAKRGLIFHFAMLTIVLSSLILSANLITGFYGSTNDDGAYHTLMIRVIIDNPASLLTHDVAPYGEYTNLYPPATHALSAFFVVTAGIPIQDVVIMFCALLPSIIALAFYATSLCLFRNRKISVLATFLSAFLALNYAWGAMSFNALPLLFSFYISVSGMGLFFEFLYKKDVDWPKSLLIGLVLFLAFQTYYVSFLILILWLLALSVTKIFRDPVRIAIRKMGSSMLNRKALISIIAFLVPLALLSPYVYIGLTHMTPAQQGYPSDIDMQIFSEGRDSIIKLVQQRVTFNWVLDIPTLADMLGRFGQIFTLASLAVCVIPVLYLVMKVWEQNSSNYGIFGSLLLVYAFSLMLMGFLTFSTNLQVGKFILSFVDPERTWQNLLIPSVLLTSVILFFCGYATFVSFKFLRAHLRRKLFWDDVLERKVPRKAIRVVAVVLLSIFVFNLALVATNSFLPKFQVSYNEISSYLNTFSAIRQDDLVVMNWIKQNASKDSVILVSAGDSGQFLTAITQRRTVYSYDNRIHSQKYANLVAGLSSDAFNLNLVPSLLDYNISYVYVGSIATSYSNAPYRAHFNPEKLRNTPYFKLVENSGDAWLFKFDPLLAKLDLDSLQKLDKCYYMDLNYPAMHVINLQNVSEYLDNCSFRRLDAEQLTEWLSLQIANGTAPESSLIMTMGVAPDMAVQGLDNTTLLRRYLDAGGRVTWIGDVPFFYQGHKGGSLTTWGLAGASTIINVNFELWDYNSTAASVTDKGFEWGMTLPDIAASQRPVSNDEITTILSEVEGYASSWQKNFNASYPNSGFIRYSYADYDGSDVDRNKDVVNLATIPLLFENSSHS